MCARSVDLFVRSPNRLSTNTTNVGQLVCVAKPQTPNRTKCAQTTWLYSCRESTVTELICRLHSAVMIVCAVCGFRSVFIVSFELAVEQTKFDIHSGFSLFKFSCKLCTKLTCTLQLFTSRSKFDHQTNENRDCVNVWAARISLYFLPVSSVRITGNFLWNCL